MQTKYDHFLFFADFEMTEQIKWRIRDTILLDFQWFSMRILKSTQNWRFQQMFNKYLHTYMVTHQIVLDSMKQTK